ncbi:MAG: HEAT repeat domain-containing protein [Gammaproteobacteria bacterium]|jgi:hypothetical protein
MNITSKRHSLAALAVGVASIAVFTIVDTVRESARPGRASIAVERLPATRPAFDYAALRRSIIYGHASLAETRRALTDTNPAALGNTIHALYIMRWHRGVVHLLNDLWALERTKYPELAWDLIAAAPARIALASTLNRIRIVNSEVYQDYIRAYQHDPHEFNRAQVAVALGYNGDPQDLPYLRAMADGDNHYVAQSAITGLALFGGNQARDILIELAAKHKGTSRGDLIGELLRTAYDWPGPASAAG